ncbi:hypothetical protein QZH41_002713 [Actinostola sp. cb2023]|nr:hypothetical protein QZH41_002713 [Actinostola sp. cb2023]
MVLEFSVLFSLYLVLYFILAAGHNHYAKSAYIYLQMMAELNDKHPEVYNFFQDGFHVVRRSDRYWAGLSTDLTIEQVLMRSVKTSGGLTRGRGMTETQRLVWLMSMPICAEVNNAMQGLTGVNYQTSEQHKDASSTRQERDFKDTNDMIGYLFSRSPFSTDPSLRCISTGVMAEDNVNADKAKDVGENILTSMKSKHVHEHTFRRKDQAVTLATKTSVKINGDSVQVDPQLLFQRLSVVATGGRFENTKEMFKYEMCSYPPALFDSSLLPRQANKPALADAIWLKSKDSQTNGPPTEGAQFVLDGGALIYRVPWQRGLTYDAICTLYVQYVKRRYDNVTIVFDGYLDSATTKDCTHQRRANVYGPTVHFDNNMVLKSKKEEFLANKENKQRFINLLSDRLKEAGYTTIHASGDADLCIVQTAVRLARFNETVLVGDDTDLLVLLCYHVEVDSHDLFFKPEPKPRSQIRRVWNLKRTKSALGASVCKNILFLHAILGCDTTSRLHGIGKAAALKKIETDSRFLQQAEIFDRPAGRVTKEDIIVAGEKALLSLYNDGSEEKLDSLRYTRFCQKVATGSSFVQPESLPPTSAAAAFHSLRVYYQIQEWKGCKQLQPVDWGWHLADGKLLPIRTELPPAHSALLEMFNLFSIICYLMK